MIIISALPQIPRQELMSGNVTESFEHQGIGYAARDELLIFSVQFHPESAPGPNDAEYLFAKFTELMKKNA